MKRDFDNSKITTNAIHINIWSNLCPPRIYDNGIVPNGPHKSHVFIRVAFDPYVSPMWDEQI